MADSFDYAPIIVKARAPVAPADLDSFDYAPIFARAPQATAPKAPAGNAPDYEPITLDSLSAAAGGFIHGLPLVGGVLKGGAQKVAAGIRSGMYGTPYADELKAVTDYAEGMEAQHPVAATAGELTGGIVGTAPIAATALGARAMGLAGGSLPANIARGVTFNAALEGADQLIKSDPAHAASAAPIAGAIGGAVPIVGRIAGPVARVFGRGVGAGLGAELSEMTPRASEAIGPASQAAREGETLAATAGGGAAPPLRPGLGGPGGPGGPGQPPRLPPPGGAGGAAGGGIGGGGLPPGETGAQMVRDLSPEARAKLRDMLGADSISPQMLPELEARLGPHGFLMEVGPTAQANAAGIASIPGEAKTQISRALGTRALETPARMRELLDQSFGPRVNLPQLYNDLGETQKKLGPLYDAWRQVKVTPFDYVDPSGQQQTFAHLMERLDAAGAVKEANRKMAVAGAPAEMQFQKLGTGDWVSVNPNILSSPEAMSKIETQALPTAQSFDYMKRSLDAKISDALAREGGADDARLYGELKNDLVNAIDHHPDPRVRGVWQQGRQAFATIADIKDASKLGERVFNANVQPDDIPFLTSGFSNAEMRAFQNAARTKMDSIMDATRRGDTVLRNKFLADAGQEKLKWIYGDARAQPVIDALGHEDFYSRAPQQIVGGSPTAGRLEAQKAWLPQQSELEEKISHLMKPEHAAGPIVGTVAHLLGLGPIGSIAAGAAGMAVQGARRKSAEAAAAALRNQVAPILTLKGAERQGALAELLRAPPQAP